MPDLNSEATEFHAQIGFCIAEWANVDDHLFRIFKECLGSPLKQSAIVYYRLPGIDIRLGTTDELVLARFPKPERQSGGHPLESVKRWKALRKGIQDLLGTRRRIAHHPVNINATVMQVGLNSDSIEVRSWFEVAIGENEQHRYGTDAPSSLGLVELKSHWREVHEIPAKLNAFFFDCIQEPAALPQQTTLQPVSEKSKDHES